MQEIFFLNYKNSVAGTGGVGTVSRDLIKLFPCIRFVYSDSATSKRRNCDVNVLLTDNEKQLWHNQYANLYI